MRIMVFVVVVTLAQVTVPAAEVEIRRTIDIAPVWAGHPVGFHLLTHGDRQYVAFYDAERRMTVGARTLEADRFGLVRLPEKVGWDSHNSVCMVVDDDGHIHLSGNMHCAPLKYFRTARPHDITAFERIDRMVGAREKRVTYPRFFRGPANELIFTYRDGGSGNGDQIYNVYDHEKQAWRRMLDSPLTDGRGRMNAYLHGPLKGPDGYFHLCWVWRDTPDCATNHDPSYARSKDLRHWETAAGRTIRLPMTAETPGLIVDPVPPGGGVINGNVVLGFDSKRRVIVSYHKFDAEGNTQLYNARLEGGRWRIARATDWDYRWDFRGGGAIVFDVRIGGVRVTPDGKLVQSCRHVKRGAGLFLLDEATLRHAGRAPVHTDPYRGGRPHLKQLGKVESAFPGLEVRWGGDSGSGGASGIRYALRWETLPANRDRPRKPPLPEPSMLRLQEFLEPVAKQER